MIYIMKVSYNYLLKAFFIYLFLIFTLINKYYNLLSKKKKHLKLLRLL